jgi:hypothetical protein
MKYALTDTAKEAARYLVKAWEAGDIEQQLTITVYRGDSEYRPNFVHGATPDFKSPSFATWRELARFDLVEVEVGYESWDILLLQELRNAVANDFEIPDSAGQGQTLNVNVQGDINGSLIAALNIGEVNLSSNQQIADQLTSALGKGFLQGQDEIRKAIEELRQSIESERQSRVGKVISEFGRCLEHGANTVAVIEGIVRATPILLRLLGG